MAAMKKALNKASAPAVPAPAMKKAMKDKKAPAKSGFSWADTPLFAPEERLYWLPPTPASQTGGWVPTLLELEHRAPLQPGDPGIPAIGPYEFSCPPISVSATQMWAVRVVRCGGVVVEKLWVACTEEAWKLRNDGKRGD